MKTRESYSPILIRIIPILILLFLSMSLFPQLSGTLTIDPSGSGDYLSLSEAANDLNTQGVNGPLTFNIKPGIYDEQIEIGNYPGAGESNRVTFQSLPADSAQVFLVFTYDGLENHIIKLDSASHLTFKRLTFNAGLGTSLHGRIFHLTGTTNNIRFQNSQFIGKQTSSSVNGAILYVSATTTHDLLFENNIFREGNYALYLQGINNPSLTSGLVFTNNFCVNQEYAALYLQYFDAPVIDNNNIQSNSANSSFRAIHLVNVYGDFRISGNEIGLSKGIGMSVNYVVGDVLNPGIIANNFISIQASNSTSDYEYGLELNYVQKIKVFHNSVLITGTSGGRISRSLLLTGSGVEIDIQNNIFANLSGEYAYYIESPTAISVSDYNDYFSTGDFIAYWSGTNIANLPALVGASPGDEHSISAFPAFVSDIDLHTTSYLIDDKGNDLTAFVSTDIDGELRNSTPDIGADEFTGTGSALAGNYTIGGNSPDYITISDAMDDLNIYGISAAVTFLIRDDDSPYDEQFEIYPIHGSDADHRVAIQPDPSNEDPVVLTCSFTNWEKNYILKASGARNFTISNLTFTQSNASYARLIQMEADCRNDSIINCTFNGAGTYSNNQSIMITSGWVNNLVIRLNQFNGGGTGVYIEESGGIIPRDFKIDSCNFVNLENAGIYLSKCKEFIIGNNELNSVFNYGLAAVYLEFCLENFQITGNRIYNRRGDGISAAYAIATPANPGIIANNFICYKDEQGDASAIKCSNSQNISICFNTVSREGDTRSYKITPLFVDGGNDIQIKNNLLCNLGEGPAVSVTDGHLTDFSHNALLTAGYPLVVYKGSNYASIDNLELSLGKSLNCLEIWPQFSASRDFHSNSHFLDGSGISISGITHDLEGDLRSDPPDIGADEFTSSVSPMASRTYTIGGISPDYPTITSAFNDLQLRGIAGHVVFTIRKGNYPEIPGRVCKIPGSGPDAMITLKSETGIPEDVLIYGPTSSTDRYMFDLISVNNLSIKGITFSPQGTYGGAIGISGIIGSINISENVFSSYNKMDFIIKSSAYSESLLIRNNVFNNGNGAVSLTGSYSSGVSLHTSINNNLIQEPGVIGISIAYQDSPEILGNRFISKTDRADALYLGYCVRDIRVIGNSAELTQPGTGISLYNCRIMIPSAAIIANNTISIAGTTTTYRSYGIHTEYCERVNLYYNSILINSPDLISSGIFLETNCTEIKVQNNISHNAGKGFAYYVIAGSIPQVSDYNNFFTKGDYLAKWENASIADLPGLRSASGKDIHSLSIDPLYISPSDLHSTEFELIEKATPIPEVTFDYDSLPRDPANPDIGAYEYTCIIPEYNISIMPACLGDSTVFIDNTTAITPGSLIEWDFDGDWVPELYADDSNDTVKYLFENPGTYQVHYIVSNAAGCLDSKDLVAEIMESPELFVETTGVYCNSADGKAVVSVLNGDGPYNYYWSTGSRDSVISDLGIGYYAIAVTDMNNCSSTEEVYIGEAIELELIQHRGSTCGKEDGIAEVIAEGGFPPYTYVWMDGDTLATDSSLVTGQHFVTVTDSKGCSARGSITIMNLETGPQITLKSITHAKCYGGRSGAIDINVSGGAPPYQIDWSNGKHTEDIENLAVGIYNVIIQDADTCIGSASIEITQPLKLNVSAAIEDADCAGYNGKAAAIVSGGTKPYIYNWSNGQTGPVAKGLSAGIYSIHVSDVNACEITEPVIINNIGGPVISFKGIQGVGCQTTNNGEIQITVSGDGPYKYEWLPGGETSANLSGLSPGTYNIKVTDRNECIGFNQAVISQEPPPVNPICLVTVDSATQMNMIVWEKLDTTDIAYYNIYRESSYRDHYEVIGSRLPEDPSFFTDSVADPTVHSWRYKLSVVDVCGNESDLSEHHKTMHLTMNLGLDNTVNLIWDKYEGFEVNNYKVYRYSSAVDWQSIASLASTVSSYTDKDTPREDLTYYIEIPLIKGCTLTDYKAATLNTVRSNRKTRKKSAYIPEYVSWEKSMDGIRIYPNPGTGIYNLSFGQVPSNTIRITILDITGKIIGISEIQDPIRNVEYKLDLEAYEDGIYQVSINSGQMLYHRILIKE